METPHTLFLQIREATGDWCAAIRAIRERFNLNLAEAKEVMLQAEGIAASLPEHLERIADWLEVEAGPEREGNGSPCSPN